MSNRPQLSARHHELILERARESVVVTDLQLEPPGPHILYVNRAFETVTGYRREEVVGRSPRVLQGPRSDRRVLARLRDDLSGGRPFEGETVNYRKNGEAYDVRWYVDVLRDDDGTPMAFLSVQRDVTAERASQAEARRLARAVDRCTELVAVLGEGGQLLVSNRALRELLTSAVPGARLAKVMAAAAVEAPGLLAAVEGAFAWSGALKVPTRSGRSLTFDGTLTPVDDDGARSGVLIARDTTQERHLQRVAAALTMTENLGFVFSGIRHELGNPINSIKAALTVLRDGDTTMPPEERREYLDDLLHEVQRVEDLLSVLKGYTDFDDPDPTDLDLSVVLDGFVRIARRDVERAGAHLEVDCPRPLPCRADARALNHILLNLVTNAVDALQPSASTTIHIRVRSLAGFAAIEVIDEGMGIPESELDRIFAPFFTNKAKGSGLGLGIVERLVASLGGTVHVTSAPGVGTTFTVLLPAR